MDKTDMLRELEKVSEALAWADKHFEYEGQMNAALHCNQRVLSSPLAQKIAAARDSVIRIADELDPGGVVAHGLRE